jgi:hypothetical protein
MARCARRALLLAVPVLLLWSSLALAAGVHALFNLEVPAGHPFPSDRFTRRRPTAAHGAQSPAAQTELRCPPFGLRRPRRPQHA